MFRENKYDSKLTWDAFGASNNKKYQKRRTQKIASFYSTPLQSWGGAPHCIDLVSQILQKSTDLSACERILFAVSFFHVVSYPRRVIFGA